jgi:hypothetical protein
MRQQDAWELLRQEVSLIAPERGTRAGERRTAQMSELDTSRTVTIPHALRSRSRIRRRRRRQAWLMRGACLQMVFVALHTTSVY